MIRELYSTLFGPSRSEVLGALIRRAAMLHAEVERYRVAALYWSQVVADTDPHQDWWSFADAKQKQQDAQMEWDRACIASTRATGELERFLGTKDSHTPPERNPTEPMNFTFVEDPSLPKDTVVVRQPFKPGDRFVLRTED